MSNLSIFNKDYNTAITMEQLSRIGKGTVIDADNRSILGYTDITEALPVYKDGRIMIQ